MDISINYLSVLVAAIASIIIGFLWYGPIFGKPWMKLMGFTPESMEAAKKGMGGRYATVTLTSFVAAYVLAHFVKIALVIDVAGALTLAFWIWLGFFARTCLGRCFGRTNPLNSMFSMWGATS